MLGPEIGTSHWLRHVEECGSFLLVSGLDRGSQRLPSPLKSVQTSVLPLLSHTFHHIMEVSRCAVNPFPEHTNKETKKKMHLSGATDFFFIWEKKEGKLGKLVEVNSFLRRAMDN